MKPDPTVVPPRAFLEVALAIQTGDAKYGAGTRFDGEPRRHLAGALRHELAYLDGREFDPETGLHHLAHAAARLLLALEMVGGSVVLGEELEG